MKPLLHLAHAGIGFFSTVGEELAAPGLAVEQLAQDAGDLAFTATGIEQSPACARWKWDKPGSVAALAGFRHVRQVWVNTSFSMTASLMSISTDWMSTWRARGSPIGDEWSPQGKKGSSMD
ncbi:MAG: hypothetical protein IBX69_08770 [Anaerolineales bacterium]|nr:hypothetical protein [Anaerolineales bacterium]